MMITILCSGSRGDIQPYIALAQALKKLGKEVRIASGGSFESFVTGHGVGFYPLSADYQSADIDPKLLKDAQTSDNPIKMLLTFNKMKKYAGIMTKEMFDACNDCELVVYHPGCTIGYFAAREMGIPSVMAAPFPMNRTKEVPSIIAYGRYRLPNDFTYTLLQSMLWMASKTGVAAFWKEHFGKMPKNFNCPFEHVDKKHPAVISCSNYVFPKPSDWNANIHQNGYWFMEETQQFNPPQELETFLKSGEKPIYIGFGSVFRDSERDEMVALSIEALKIAGKRGIISGMGMDIRLPPDMLAVGPLPHTWLFDKMDSVCHHGGAGTSAAGFRAGVPSVIIPFSNDQFAWAHRSYDLGVGTRPISRKQLTAKRLAEAFKEVESNSIRQKALMLGKQIRTENGALSCAKVIAELC